MRVFIIHARPEHGDDDRPLALANALRGDGFDARIDDYAIPDTTWAACPSCGQPMKLRAVVLGPPASLTIVAGLMRATGPP